MDIAVTASPPLRLHNAVQRMRDARGWTMVELARRASINHRTVALIEAGDHNPTADVMLRIADAFGVSLGEVFWSDDGRAA